jgi:hypothetical protein
MVRNKKEFLSISNKQLCLIVSAFINGTRRLQYAVRQCGFAVIHVGYNAKISYPLRRKIRQIHILDASPPIISVSKCPP